VVTLLGLGVVHVPAAAEPAKLTCAPSALFQCDAIYECTRVPTEIINFPHFFIADLKSKSITGRRPDGTNLNTVIQHQAQEGSALVLQGMEAGRGWSLAVDTSNGKLSLGVAGSDVGFVGLGACLVE